MGRSRLGAGEAAKRYFAEEWDRAPLRLMRAITENDREDIRTLLALRTPTEFRIEGDTPLTRAVIIGNLWAVKSLVRQEADVNGRDGLGRTPLMLAAHHGYTEILDYLLRHGAGPDETSFRGRTALIEAAEAGHTGCLRLLFRCGVDLNVHDRGWSANGETALMKAAYEGLEEVVGLLLKAKADVNRHAMFDGVTALGLAARAGRFEVVRMLVAAGADLNVEDDRGRTPLAEAQGKGYSKVARYLSRRGAR